MASILRYAARVARKTGTRKQSIAIVGAGRLATVLAPALRDAGYRITEVVARDGSQSRAVARTLARKVGARAVTASTATLGAELLWLCVPDREIRGAAGELAARIAGLKSEGSPSTIRFAFHSSGALVSRELESLRKLGVAVAAVHPLMTFVPASRPTLEGVPFALEGDSAATKLAAKIVGDLGGEQFSVPGRRKVAYHAWATMLSPLLLAYLVTLEDAARSAGLRREEARRLSLPIIRQTLDNYYRLGPQHSFSGPFIRGDVETVAKHLGLLKKSSTTRAVYNALGRAALAGLPVKNRNQLRRLLEE
jgi:predicted short-subunit dehydrogenase-like oxidoreductase (DUF2520 family)